MSSDLESLCHLLIVVPIPTLPLPETAKRVVPAEFSTSKVRAPSAGETTPSRTIIVGVEAVEEPETRRRAEVEVVPMPTFPEVASIRARSMLLVPKERDSPEAVNKNVSVFVPV